MHTDTAGSSLSLSVLIWVHLWLIPLVAAAGCAGFIRDCSVAVQECPGRLEHLPHGKTKPPWSASGGPRRGVISGWRNLRKPAVEMRLVLCLVYEATGS